MMGSFMMQKKLLDNLATLLEERGRIVIVMHRHMGKTLMKEVFSPPAPPADIEQLQDASMKIEREHTHVKPWHREAWRSKKGKGRCR